MEYLSYSSSSDSESDHEDVQDNTDCQDVHDNAESQVFRGFPELSLVDDLTASLRITERYGW